MPTGRLNARLSSLSVALRVPERDEVGLAAVVDLTRTELGRVIDQLQILRHEMPDNLEWAIRLDRILKDLA